MKEWDMADRPWPAARPRRCERIARVKAQDLGALVLLAALWGGSFLFVRVAAPVLGPLLVAEARVVLAGAALLLFAALAGRSPTLLGRWKSYVTMGALNAAIPYTLISAAELHLTAGLAAILNAATPLCIALVAAAWLKERLTPARCLGLLLGLAGVAVLVGWSPVPLGPVILLSAGASLLACFSYALAGVYAARTFVSISPLSLAIGQQVGAALILLPAATPVALATAPGMRPSPGVVASVLALALLSTSVAYLLYFRLIAAVGPTKTLSVTFLVPVFGVLWSVLFLHETVGAGTMAGLAIILVSVALTTVVRIPPGFLPRRVARTRKFRPAPGLPPRR
jgi:drug/metabolite transporter (DMT)-like permease